MGDIVFIGVIVAFFALAALYIRACARIVGAGESSAIAAEVVDERQAA
jgi:hypothetical protein